MEMLENKGCCPHLHDERTISLMMEANTGAKKFSWRRSLVPASGNGDETNRLISTLECQQISTSKSLVTFLLQFILAIE
jgi:hypothetical protein